MEECKKRDADLVVINSEAENFFISGIANINALTRYERQYWIGLGLHYNEELHWQDGSYPSYQSLKESAKPDRNNRYSRQKYYVRGEGAGGEFLWHRTIIEKGNSVSSGQVS